MTRSELITAIAAHGLFSGRWELDDNAYDCMSAAFVAQAWERWVVSLPDVLKASLHVGGGKEIAAPFYIAEVFDCDNAAKQFANFLDLCMAADAATRKVARGNAASGFLKFSVGGDANLGHALCWFCDYDGVIHTFEPQNGSLRPLTADEKQTITFGESV